MKYINHYIIYIILCTPLFSKTFEEELIQVVKSVNAESIDGNPEDYTKYLDLSEDLNKIVFNMGIEDLYSLEVEKIYKDFQKESRIINFIFADYFLRSYLSKVIDEISQVQNYPKLDYNFSDKISELNIYSETLTNIYKMSNPDVHRENLTSPNLLFIFYGFDSFEEYVLKNEIQYPSYINILDLNDICELTFCVTITEKFRKINFIIYETFMRKGGDLSKLSLQDDSYIESVVSKEFLKEKVFSATNDNYAGSIDIYMFKPKFRSRIKDPLLVKLWTKRN